MSAGKYPVGSGVVDAGTYKTLMAESLKVDRNLVSTRLAGATWGANAELYDHLASTVTAIEQGQSANWAPQNLISGMNAASLDVKDASIELLEICRQELMKLDEIKKDPRLTTKEKEDEIKTQKEYVFGLLKDIREANAPEKTFQWSRNFFSSIGNKLSSSMTRGNIAAGILSIMVCVAMNMVVHAVSLAALGFFAPYVLPVVIGIVAVFWLVKMVKGVYNAYVEASSDLEKSKTLAGDKVLSRVAKISENDLNASSLKKDMEDAKGILDNVDLEIKGLKEDLQKLIDATVKPANERIKVLNDEIAVLTKTQTAQKSIIDAVPKPKETALKAAREAYARVTTEITSKNSELLDLTRKIKDEFSPKIAHKELDIRSLQNTTRKTACDGPVILNV